MRETERQPCRCAAGTLTDEEVLTLDGELFWGHCLSAVIKVQRLRRHRGQEVPRCLIFHQAGQGYLRSGQYLGVAVRTVEGRPMCRACAELYGEGTD